MPSLGENLRFDVHWLNNKELQFTMEKERLIAELSRQAHLEKQRSDEESAAENNSEEGGSRQ